MGFCVVALPSWCSEARGEMVLEIMGLVFVSHKALVYNVLVVGVVVAFGGFVYCRSSLITFISFRMWIVLWLVYRVDFIGFFLGMIYLSTGYWFGLVGRLVWYWWVTGWSGAVTSLSWNATSYPSLGRDSY